MTKNIPGIPYRIDNIVWSNEDDTEMVVVALAGRKNDGRRHFQFFRASVLVREGTTQKVLQSDGDLIDFNIKLEPEIFTEAKEIYDRFLSKVPFGFLSFIVKK